MIIIYYQLLIKTHNPSHYLEINVNNDYSE